jgi:hypothetical protein
MSCAPITSLKEAEADIPSSVLPIKGLRRDSQGNLTQDAITTVIDGIKSRGIDPTDRAVKEKLQHDLGILLCSVNNQYEFLMKELLGRLSANESVDSALIDKVREKNLFIQDILNVSRHLKGITVFDTSSEYIEGWQKTVPLDSPAMKEGFQASLQSDMAMLDTKSYSHLRNRMITVSAEKNVMASNYLGIYGLLNIVAVGLLIYVSVAPAKGGAA